MLVIAVVIATAITRASIRRVRTAGRRNKVTCIRRKHAAFCCYKRYAGGADGATRPPLLSAGRCGRRLDRNDPGVRGSRRPDRLGYRRSGARGRGRGGAGHPVGSVALFAVPSGVLAV